MPIGLDAVEMVTGSHSPLLHEVPQSFAVQSCPHDPQLVGSLVTSTQSSTLLLEQLMYPVSHTQPQTPWVQFCEACAGHVAQPPHVAPCVPHSLVDSLV
jgi:hypothetical protein